MQISTLITRRCRVGPITAMRWPRLAWSGKIEFAFFNRQKPAAAASVSTSIVATLDKALARSSLKRLTVSATRFAASANLSGATLPCSTAESR